MGTVFFELTVVICLSAILAIVFRFLKQPAILAYILTGIIIGPFGAFNLQNQEFLRSMADIGITLLLFLLALELRLSGLRSVGKVSVIIGIFQITLTIVSAYIVSILLGFTIITALYLAIALSFSSTIIVVKLLSDRKDLNSLHGKLTVGLLLLQDFFAISVLVLLSAFQTNGHGTLPLLDFIVVILKGAILLGFILISSRYLPRIVDSIARSEESLFLFSLAWVFGIAAVVSSPIFGFPIEIGGFAAGIALANSSENFQIVARLRALRDFFITLFFVVLGIQISFSNLSSIVVPAIVLSIFVVAIKPLIVLFIVGEQGYRKRTSFFVASSMGQLSEFSLIILFLGQKLGHIDSQIVSIGTLVAIITFILSTYCVAHKNWIYRTSQKYLGMFERKDNHLIEKVHDASESEFENLTDHVALIGANRMGMSILEALKEEGEKVLVVDFDPDIVKGLQKEGVLILFGDISDAEIQEKARLSKAKHVISTITDIEDNLYLIRSLNKTNRSAKIVVVAGDTSDAKQLYKAGADYVIQPHLIGGRHLAKVIKEDKLDTIHTLKNKDLKSFS